MNASTPKPSPGPERSRSGDCPAAAMPGRESSTPNASPPDPSTAECLTCHYFENGRCRRNPPTGGQWSSVSSYDWCGEYVKRAMSEEHSNLQPKEANDEKAP